MHTTATCAYVSLIMQISAQRKVGRRKKERHLADLFFNVADGVMAKGYVVFTKEPGIVYFTYLEKKHTYL